MNFVSDSDPRFYQEQSEFHPFVINDLRPPKSFQYVTIAGQSVKQQNELLFTNLLVSNLPTSLVVAADLLCSFQFEEKLWPCMVNFYVRHINTENAYLAPKLLNNLYIQYMSLKEECKHSLGKIRNHRQLRLDLAITLFVLCKSHTRPKHSSFQFTKGYFQTNSRRIKKGEKEEMGSSSIMEEEGIISQLCVNETDRLKRKRKLDRELAETIQTTKTQLIDKSNQSSFYLQLVSQNLRATSMMFIETFEQSFGLMDHDLSTDTTSSSHLQELSSTLEIDDEMREHLKLSHEKYLSPFRIFLNEFLFSLQQTNEVRNMHYLQYWFHCMMDMHSKKVSKNPAYKQKMKKADEFTQVFTYLHRFMGDRKPSAFVCKEHKDAHIVWVVWCGIIQICETRLGQLRYEAEKRPLMIVKYQRVLAALSELLLLFYLLFPLPVSNMHMFMNIVFELFLYREKDGRLRIPCNMSEMYQMLEIGQADDRQVPNFQVLSLKPFEIIVRQIHKLEEQL